MAMGRRKKGQRQLFVDSGSLPTAPGHPFYKKLNQVLGKHGFDEFVEAISGKFYAEKVGRPSIPPGVYFRMMLIGYFEKLDSERGIAWRCKDSLGLRGFLGYELHEEPPDHSTISRTRRLIDLETHQAVFRWVLEVLAKAGLIKGKTIGIDGTTLEANAALRSIVRRDTGESYEAFLKELAKESGIETPTREDLARLDRKRPKKGSNDDWTNPNDRDAQITKMKDGRTHEAHKDEHAVDMATGAVLAVGLYGGAAADTETLATTLKQAEENLWAAEEAVNEGVWLREDLASEVVLDKGYHSNETLVYLDGQGFRTYVSEPRRGRRRWGKHPQAQGPVYANRRRIKGRRGLQLLRKRGELLERGFTHYLDNGGMRRTHLRRHPNILKRLLVQVAGFNLGLVMRKLVGRGTPRELAASLQARFWLILGLWNRPRPLQSWSTC